MQQSYTPNQTILTKYAKLIVQYGLQNPDGSKPKAGSVVYFSIPEVAKPLYIPLQTAILQAGYNPLGEFIPSATKEFPIRRSFYEQAKPAQLDFYPEHYRNALTDQADCTIAILAPTAHSELEQLPSRKLERQTKARAGTISHRWQKINSGKLNWTLALYGTDEAAAEAGLTLQQYWNQIIKACYLRDSDPVKTWRRISQTVQKTAQTLTDLEIKSVHMFGKDMDITIGIGKDRVWRAGGGHNIPSFEVFTSPTWQSVNGWIHLNQPLYHQGTKIEGITLWFKDGVVVKSDAHTNHAHLKQLLKLKNGNKLGEFSLTDGRLSKITKFMAETLFDENMGGRYGNTHVALGMAYKDCYRGTPKSSWTDAEWDKRGFNDSVLHADIISTSNRTVVATLGDGSETTIYKDGKFTV